ncbi:MAG: nuclear transport factor 2 family protein, partial [Verrucomicrobiota bacterium]
PYYTEKDRGLIPEYDNKFNVASWEPWLTYDAHKTAGHLKKPTLLVHSEAAAIPQGAKTYARLMDENARVIWLDEVTQFDFYDKPEAVNAAADAVAGHFNRTMPEPVKKTDADTLRIKTMVESVAALADADNFEALEKLYADEIEVDYTSLTGGEMEVKSAPALMTQWASVLPGFDRTKHELSNIEIALAGNKATATSDVEATHLVNGQRWTVWGHYLFKLEKDENLWRITAHRFTLTDEQGHRDVFAAASANAKAHPSSYLLRQKTIHAVRTFLLSLEEKNMEQFASVWADDAVQDMPYAPKGFPGRVIGKEHILKHYAAWPENAGKADFTSQLTFYPMMDPEMVFAEFEGQVDIIPTKRKYEQQYGGLFHVKNGKITLFREYFNPTPFVYAFGLDEGGEFNDVKPDAGD